MPPPPKRAKGPCGNEEGSHATTTATATATPTEAPPVSMGPPMLPPPGPRPSAPKGTAKPAAEPPAVPAVPPKPPAAAAPRFAGGDTGAFAELLALERSGEDMSEGQQGLLAKMKKQCGAFAIPEALGMPEAGWALEVVKGDEVAEELPLDGAPFYLFGKDASLSDVAVQHPSASRSHCALHFAPDQALTLTDLRSTHGTFVNRKRLPPGGTHTLKFYPEDEWGKPGPDDGAKLQNDFFSIGASARTYHAVPPASLYPTRKQRERAQREALLRQQAEEALASADRGAAQLQQGSSGEAGGGQAGVPPTAGGAPKARGGGGGPPQPQTPQPPAPRPQQVQPAQRGVNPLLEGGAAAGGAGGLQTAAHSTLPPAAPSAVAAQPDIAQLLGLAEGGPAAEQEEPEQLQPQAQQGLAGPAPQAADPDAFSDDGVFDATDMDGGFSGASVSTAPSALREMKLAKGLSQALASAEFSGSAWAPLDAVLRRLRCRAEEAGVVLQQQHQQHASKSDVKRLVLYDPTKRFLLKKEGGVYYVSQGNAERVKTVEKALDLVPVAGGDAEDGLELIHGTSLKAWKAIKKSGLSCRGGAKYIYFVASEPDEPGAIEGLASPAQVYIYVDAAKALRDGVRFMKTADGSLFCSEGKSGVIKPKYFAQALVARSQEVLL